MLIIFKDQLIIRSDGDIVKISHVLFAHYPLRFSGNSAG